LDDGLRRIERYNLIAVDEIDYLPLERQAANCSLRCSRPAAASGPGSGPTALRLNRSTRPQLVHFSLPELGALFGSC
jgi:hypothetical protein